MATKITEYTALAVPAGNDLIETVDVSDTSMAASGTNKKLTLDDLWSWMVPTRAVITETATSFTGLLGQAGCYIRCTGTNPTYTVPPNSTAAFPVGTQIDGIGTATAMTLIAGSGVTLVRARSLVTVGAGSGWTIIKVATDTWDVHGDFV